MSDRIALFLPALHGGGAERMSVNLANQMVAMGHSVDMVVASAQGPLRQELRPDVRLIDLRAGRVLRALLPLARYLHSERPRFLLSNQNHANILAVWARGLARCDSRLFLREANTPNQDARSDLDRRNRLLPWLMRQVYPHADGIIAVSDGVARDLRTVLRTRDHHKIHVIYNPTITPALLTSSQGPIPHPWLDAGRELPVVLAAGRLAKAKGFDTLLRALALAREQRELRLLVLGEGRERMELEALRDGLGLADCVQFVGYQSNPAAWMARADLFVLSSEWEGLPNTLIEALALGCPVVSTDCPSGPREILEEGRLGRLVPVGDASAMAQAMLDELAAPCSGAEQRQASLLRFYAAESTQSYLTLFSGGGNT